MAPGVTKVTRVARVAGARARVVEGREEEVTREWGMVRVPVARVEAVRAAATVVVEATGADTVVGMVVGARVAATVVEVMVAGAAGARETAAQRVALGVVL